jgi:hypothetical protein
MESNCYLLEIYVELPAVVKAIIGFETRNRETLCSPWSNSAAHAGIESRLAIHDIHAPLSSSYGSAIGRPK